MFSVAKLSFVFRRRSLVLLALLAIAVVAAVAHGHPQPFGMWDGPI